jgi:hypothetical protein
MTIRKSKSSEGDNQRTIDFGRPETHPPFADNSVTTSKYSLLSFFPLVSEFCCLKLLAALMLLNVGVPGPELPFSMG